MTDHPSGLFRPRPEQRKKIWFAAALLGLVLLAHGPALWGAFIWDDFGLITQNRLIHDWNGLWQFWFTTRAPDYFPLTSTTWWIEWRLWGAHPAGYHAVNLLLHAASSVLIWQILTELELPGAFLAAAIWAVHPVQVESVAWIAERKNTLSVAFAAASMLLFLRNLKHKQSRAVPGPISRYARETSPRINDMPQDVREVTRAEDGPALSLLYFASLLTFAAALLAKTSVAPLPIVILTIAMWRGRTLRQSILETIPFFTITLVLSAITIFFQSQRSIGSDVVRTDGLASRIAIAGRAVWFYLEKLAWPTPLSFVYPRWPTGDVSPHLFIPLLLLGPTFVALAIGRRKWGWIPLLGMSYFVLMLLPVLGLINIYFMRYSLVADHWQYAASIGPIAIIAALVSHTPLKFRYVISGCVLLPLIIFSERQSMLYRSGETLWSDTIQKNPTSWMPHISLGQILTNDHRYAEAEQHYLEAAALVPELPEPRFSLGTVYAKDGRLADAIVEYQKAIALKPHVPVMYTEVGHCYAQMNQFDQARDWYEKAIEYAPNDADTRYQLGSLLEQMQQHAAAIDAYTAAVNIDPDLAAAQFNLANCLLADNRIAEAADHLRRAVTTAPQWAAAHTNFAYVLLKQGNRDEAADEYRKALDIDPNLTAARVGLAAARRGR